MNRSTVGDKVVGNGKAMSCQVTCEAGTIKVQALMIGAGARMAYDNASPDPALSRRLRHCLVSRRLRVF